MSDRPPSQKVDSKIANTFRCNFCGGRHAHLSGWTPSGHGDWYDSIPKHGECPAADRQSAIDAADPLVQQMEREIANYIARGCPASEGTF